MNGVRMRLQENTKEKGWVFNEQSKTCFQKVDEIESRLLCADSPKSMHSLVQISLIGMRQTMMRWTMNLNERVILFSEIDDFTVFCLKKESTFDKVILLA